MARKQFSHKYVEIISFENLLQAWREFVSGKRSRKDVQDFERDLMTNLTTLHLDLVSKNYRHSEYTAFNISDPKPRRIHKAVVRDRVLHHALYRILYPFFAATFIDDSFSCQNGKGTHKAINRFRALAFKVSKNHTRTCWVLKCDIKKFFASINHQTLLDILRSYIPDQDIIDLLKKIIYSFELYPGNGLPLGNLTSQLFCNVYMNEFDQFVKHRLKVKRYIRYADDFVFLSENKVELEQLIPKISDFLEIKLGLKLHPDKVYIKSIASGVDFLGWVHFLDHRVLRKITRRRMFKRIYKNLSNETFQSYLGLISHGNTCRIKQELLNWQGSLAKD